MAARWGAARFDGHDTPAPAGKHNLVVWAQRACEARRVQPDPPSKRKHGMSCTVPGGFDALASTPFVLPVWANGLWLVGAVGFEPTTFRPPAERPGASMRPVASPPSPSSPPVFRLDVLDVAVGTTAVPRWPDETCTDTAGARYGLSSELGYVRSIGSPPDEAARARHVAGILPCRMARVGRCLVA